MPSDLAAKLRGLGAASGVRRPAPRRADIGATVAGRYLSTRAGECFVAERRYALGHLQGTLTLQAAIDLPDQTRLALQRAAGGQAVDPRRALFLDTETTGLSGGTGTYAFLIGLGYFSDDAFVLEQYFMRHPGEELALLHAVEPVLARHPLWVSFNGKGFDVPLLGTRFQCARRQPLAPPAGHLDLLGIARRLWRKRLPSCSLGTIERAVLGVARGDDVPSWTIPGLYFDYVRRGQVAPLAGVFAHNADDIVSMVALLAQVGAVLAVPAQQGARVDALAVVRLLGQAGLADFAAEWAQAALPGVPPVEQGQLRWELARLLRRAGARDAAVEQWRQLAGRPGPWAPLAFEALAKHYEYQVRDYEAARQATEAALAALALLPAGASDAQRETLERRLGRLFFRSRLQREARVRPVTAGSSLP